MPLPDPYINKINLKDYTQLLVEKLVNVIITNNKSVTDYEREYSSNPLVSVITLNENIVENSDYVLPFSYIVGSNQLIVTVSGYTMYPGLDYYEVGSNGDSSQTIHFNTNIDIGSILGIVIYPRTISFGRNIIINEISSDTTNVVHLTGNEEINGIKIFKKNHFGSSKSISENSINVSDSTVFTKTITEDTTFTFSGVPSNTTGIFTLILTNGGTKIVTWPSNVKWTDGITPDLSTSGSDIITFITPDGGISWYACVNLHNAF